MSAPQRWTVPGAKPHRAGGFVAYGDYLELKQQLEQQHNEAAAEWERERQRLNELQRGLSEVINKQRQALQEQVAGIPSRDRLHRLLIAVLRKVGPVKFAGDTELDGIEPGARFLIVTSIESSDRGFTVLAE